MSYNSQIWWHYIKDMSQVCERPPCSKIRNGTLTGTRWLEVGCCHILNRHEDVINWKHLLRYWSIVRGIHRSPVNSPHKGQWRRALIFSLICVWINSWVNNRKAGDLRRYRAHYDVIVMNGILPATACSSDSNSGPLFNKKTPSYWCGDSHCEPETVDRRRHLHCSEITACVLYGLIPSFFSFISRFWSGSYLRFELHVKRYRRKCLSIPNVTGCFCPNCSGSSVSKAIHSHDKVRQPCLYFTYSEGVFDRPTHKKYDLGVSDFAVFL